MARIRVVHGIDDLYSDLAAIPVKLHRQAPRLVKKNAELGERTAKRFARQFAGPHGKNYYKRISSEMLSPFAAEWGPEGEPKTDFVGVGFRNGGPNMDLPNSADIVGPKFADDIGDLVGGLFW